MYHGRTRCLNSATGTHLATEKVLCGAEEKAQGLALDSSFMTLPEKVLSFAVDLIPEGIGSKAFECGALEKQGYTVNTAERQVGNDTVQAGKGQFPIIAYPRKGFESHTVTCINIFQALKHFFLALVGPQESCDAPCQVRSDLFSSMPVSHPLEHILSSLSVLGSFQGSG